MSALNFSIIIPHYNIPKLLRRCLASIPQRDDLEIIIVDDNNNPEIVDFDNFPGSERQDVHIIFSKQNGGGGFARNQGLAVARGKWILFADSDDYFTFCFDEMLDKYRDSEADIVFFNVLACDSEYYTSTNRGLSLLRYIKLSDSNRQLAELHLRYSFGEPWCKLIKRQIIETHNIRFDCTPINNDTTFSYLVGHHAQNIEIDKHAIYILTSRKQSVSSKLTDDKRLVRIEVFARREKFLKDNNIRYKNFYNTLHYRVVLDMLFSRQWTLAKEGIRLILRYNPSRICVLQNIVKLVPERMVLFLKA